ncbi:3'-5' exonuclease [Bacteroides sedimenti]|uniref:DNA polymerase III subunit epsilon n=1 Tax=Bacteroides sedimenti TaxID=2136147 RepID=A0ABM8ICV6_9BACE
MESFAAIDFETANGQRSSVCSVGVIIVEDGIITDRFHSFIRPRPNFYTYWTTQVHGMTFEDTKESPDFPDVWANVSSRLNGLPLVAHNSPFDEGCLKAVFNLYGLSYPDYQFYCTCRLSKKMHKGLVNHQLHTVSQHCGYDLKQHHHALADAEACARIAINMFQETRTESFEELHDFVKRNY